MTWGFAEARDRLSEVVDRALSDGPQTVTRGTDAVVVVSAAEYAELTARRMDFKEYLRSGPSLEGVDLERDKSPMRDVEF